MTLIAAYRAHNIPILLGDFLITRDSKMTTFRKKVHKLSPNLVVAWTGHAIVAEQVISILRDRLSDGRATKQRLEELLTNCTDFEHDRIYVKLLGWVIDDGEHCFRWNSGFPSEVFYGDAMYDGVGEEVIARFCGPSGITGQPLPQVPDIHRAVMSTLNISTYLTSDGALDGRDQGFGPVYEFLYLDHDGFHYADDVLYLDEEVQIDADDNIVRFGPSGIMVKYLTFGEFSAVYVYDPSRNRRELHFIPPADIQHRAIADRTYGEALSRTANDKFPTPSKYYCIFLRLVAPDFSGPRLSVLIPAGNSLEREFIQAVNDEGIDLRCPHDTVRRLYRDIRADQERRRSK